MKFMYDFANSLTTAEVVLVIIGSGLFAWWLYLVVDLYRARKLKRRFSALWEDLVEDESIETGMMFWWVYLPETNQMKRMNSEVTARNDKGKLVCMTFSNRIEVWYI